MSWCEKGTKGIHHAAYLVQIPWLAICGKAMMTALSAACSSFGHSLHINKPHVKTQSHCSDTGTAKCFSKHCVCGYNRWWYIDLQHHVGKFSFLFFFFLNLACQVSWLHITFSDHMYQEKLRLYLGFPGSSLGDQALENKLQCLQYTHWLISTVYGLFTPAKANSESCSLFNANTTSSSRNSACLG